MNHFVNLRNELNAECVIISSSFLNLLYLGRGPQNAQSCDEVQIVAKFRKIVSCFMLM